MVAISVEISDAIRSTRTENIVTSRIVSPKQIKIDITYWFTYIGVSAATTRGLRTEWIDPGRSGGLWTGDSAAEGD